MAMEQLRQKSVPIEKHIFLQTIQDSDEVLYYAILISHTTEGEADLKQLLSCCCALILYVIVMPLVYTPVVGEVINSEHLATFALAVIFAIKLMQACQKWSHMYRQQPRGLYITLNHRGRIRRILDNYPVKDVKVSARLR